MRPILFDVSRLYGAIFMGVIALWAIPELAGLACCAHLIGQSARSGSFRVVMAGVVVGLSVQLASTAFLPQFAMTRHRYATYWLGIALMLLGVGLRWYAIRTLGRSFAQDVAIRTDQTLIQSGPYRLVRHPAYSSTLLTMTGMGIVLATGASLFVILLCGLTGVLYRIRIEEAALLDAFGQAYRDYMQRTYGLIPYVW